jgi:hypothetical protein
MQWYGNYGSIEHWFIRRGRQLVTGAAVKVVGHSSAHRRKEEQMIISRLLFRSTRQFSTGEIKQISLATGPRETKQADRAEG